MNEHVSEVEDHGCCFCCVCVRVCLRFDDSCDRALFVLRLRGRSCVMLCSYKTPNNSEMKPEHEATCHVAPPYFSFVHSVHYGVESCGEIRPGARRSAPAHGFTIIPSLCPLLFNILGNRGGSIPFDQLVDI